MKSEMIKPEGDREYPCLVEDNQTGDGEKPTVYLKPAAHLSIVVVHGCMSMQMGWKLGYVLDSSDPEVASNFGVDEGGEIHEDLPLFKGKVVLEND